MEVHILTIFPDMFASPLQASILQRAQERCLLQVQVHNLRDFTTDRHHVTDDYPYGGGAGMIMKPEPIVTGIQEIQARFGPAYVILFSPQGTLLTQDLAKTHVATRASAPHLWAVWRRRCPCAGVCAGRDFHR
jgi:tRNA (guanine37-N1)-methyltransferase